MEFKSLVKTSLAAAGIALVGSAASAVTVDMLVGDGNPGGVNNGGLGVENPNTGAGTESFMGVASSGSSGLNVALIFNWDGVQGIPGDKQSEDTGAAYAQITMEGGGDLFFTHATHLIDEVSKLSIVNVSTGIHSFADGATVAAQSWCGGVTPLTSVIGNCTLVGDAGAPGSAIYPSATTSIFSLAAGETYRIGLFEDEVPTSGTMAFTIRDTETPAVPLPAAGFLLIGAFGALAAAKRRKAS